MHIESTPITQLDYLPPTTFFRTARTTETGKPVSIQWMVATLSLGQDQIQRIRANCYIMPLQIFKRQQYNNTFLTIAPDCLLYAALGESEPFLMNDQRLAVWASLYDRARIQLTSSDDRGEFSGNPMAMSVT
ncbi:MAG: hypothetical protein CM15mV83_580 [uncultured marine virus]|nr:MAG: hypothetical protein CM15mV83_580 [uncultured marine virus]